MKLFLQLKRVMPRHFMTIMLLFGLSYAYGQTVVNGVVRDERLSLIHI